MDLPVIVSVKIVELIHFVLLQGMHLNSSFKRLGANLFLHNTFFNYCKWPAINE